MDSILMEVRNFVRNQILIKEFYKPMENLCMMCAGKVL